MFGKRRFRKNKNDVQQDLSPERVKSKLDTLYSRSESTVFGPSIDDTFLYLLCLILPEWLQQKVGLMEDEDLKLSRENYLRETESELDLTKGRTKQDTRGKDFVEEQFDLEDWLRKEYCKLACEVCRARMDTNEVTHCPIEPAMLEARRFVLNRLAELLEKKQMIEAEYRNRVRDRGDTGK